MAKPKHKRIKSINSRPNSVERWVARWANRRAVDYSSTGARGALSDLQYGGCSSGMIGELIYTKDVERFFQRHYHDIFDIVDEYEREIGEPVQHKDSNDRATWYVWLAVEIMGNKLLDELENNNEQHQA